METPIRPTGASGEAGGRPPSTRRQVSPPSSLRNSPLSAPPSTSVHGFRSASQIAANSRRGFDGSIARSTAPARSETWRTASQLAPPSSVR